MWDQPRVQEEESEFLGEVGDAQLVKNADGTFAARSVTYAAALKRHSNTRFSSYLPCLGAAGVFFGIFSQHKVVKLGTSTRMHDLYL